MSYATAVAALPFVACLPSLPSACWPYLAASAFLQVGYGVFLAYAYRFGELGQVYPIVRGSVPPMVGLGAFAFAGQPLSPMLLAGVALVSAGIAATAFGRGRVSAKPLALALATGLLVASYLTVDGVGVRLAGDPQSYAAWIFIVYGVLMPLSYRLLRGRFAAGLLTREGVKAAAGGIVSLLAYGAIVSALALGPLAPISALREMSVVFSVVIGRLLLGEAVTLRRVLASATVTTGVVVIGLSG